MSRAFVLLVALAGCYSPGYRDCDVTCPGNGACPGGLSCVDQFCRTSGFSGTCGPQPLDAAIDGANVDAPYAAGTWGVPTLVPLGMTGIGDPTLTEDMLEMYVVVSADIYVTTRATLTSAWAPLALVAELNSTTIDNTPNVSGDGLVMFLSSDRNPTAGDVDIWSSTRPDRASPWGSPQHVDELATTGGDNGADMSADRRSLYFATNVPASATGVDLYVTTRASITATWDKAAPISDLMTTANEAHPSVSPDQLFIYFQRHVGGADDLFEASRANLTKPWIASPIDELNTPQGDTDPWVSPDGHTIYFDSNRGGAGFELYTATR